MSGFRKISKTKPSSSSTEESSSSSSSSSSNGKSKIPGVKPWTSSSPGVVSTGHREFDEILGGGHVLGTSMMFLSDTHTDYASTMMKYQIAEAISMKHRTVIVDTNSTTPFADEEYLPDCLLSLPYNLNSAKVDGDSNTPTATDSDTSSSSSLKIAWQYEKYIPKPSNDNNKSSSSNSSSSSSSSQSDVESRYCCSYDLSKRYQTSLFQSNPPIIMQSNQFDKLSLIMTDIKSIIQQSQDDNVVRIFIPDIDRLLQFDKSFGASSKSLCQFMLELNHIIRDKRVTVTISYQPTTNSINHHIILQLVHVIDTVLAVDSFIGRLDAVPYEFKDFVGFFKICKIQQIGSLASYRPPYERYGLKRNRRKLSIEPLHLPPEESRSFGTAGTDEHFKAKAALLNANSMNTTTSSHPSRPVTSTTLTMNSKEEEDDEDDRIKSKQSGNGRIELSLESDGSHQPPAKANAAQTEGKKRLADSLAAARANRQAMKQSSSSSTTTTTTTPPLAPGSSCSRANLDF